MPRHGEQPAHAQGRSEGPPQPALDPLLAHFSAMGMAQVLHSLMLIPASSDESMCSIPPVILLRNNCGAEDFDHVTGCCMSATLACHVGEIVV